MNDKLERLGALSLIIHPVISAHTGRKIEVKIITAGYYDDEDNTMHILSDTESREFNKMIVTILVSTYK